MSMNYLDKFNDTFVEFVDDLCIAYPNDGELRMCKAVLGTVLSVNDRIIYKFFMTNIITTFETQISQRDEAFFTTKDYSQFAANIAGAGQVIEKIKSLWADMTEANKDSVWRYLKVLVALAKRVPT